MSKIDDESQEVISAAQRFVKNGVRDDLETFDLSILKKADYQLSYRDKDTGWRKAIRDRIGEVENSPEIIEAKLNFWGININLKAAWEKFSNKIRRIIK